VSVDSIALSFIVDPLAVKHVAIYVPEFTLAASFVLTPVSFIASSIRPNLDAVAVFESAHPLSAVDSSILEDNIIPLLHYFYTRRSRRFQFDRSLSA